MGKQKAGDLSAYWIVKAKIDGWHAKESFGPFDIEDHDKAMDCVIALAGRKDVTSAEIEIVER